MPIQLRPSAEPIPGYRLIAPLGRGGFGEVWTAEAPGGLLKAIKILHGRDTDDDSVRRNRQELQSLRQIMAIRHPYLLTIDRVDIVDGRLVIVTELADSNLEMEFKACAARRLPGIPRPDLLRYLAEAAEVLDLLSHKHQLQHLDVKPQNLFLLHDHVKVADFGLVANLSDLATRTECDLTPIYASPETFERRVTPHCDQYSLAIVYMELLTGHRPFHGGTLEEWQAQHTFAAPDLSALSAHDRPIVSRALSKRPEDRFPDCQTLIRALVAANQPEALLANTFAAQTGIPLEPEADMSVTAFAPTLQDDLPSARTPVQTAPVEITGDGSLMPTLVIGLGGTGLAVLRAMRGALTRRYGDLKNLPCFRLLYIDTDPDTLSSAADSSVAPALDSAEVLPLRLNRPGYYLNPRGGRGNVASWHDPNLPYRIRAANPQVSGCRALGRLALSDHYRSVSDKLNVDLNAITQPENLTMASMHTGVAMRTNRPRVYLVTHLGGGTGSGIFLDLAFAVRHRLQLLGYEEPDLVGIFMLPNAANSHHANPLPLANTYAALTELNHFSQPGVSYVGNFDGPDGQILESASPFRRFCLVPYAPSAGKKSAEQLLLASDYLLLEMTTTLGRTADDSRPLPPPGAVGGQSFGLSLLSSRDHPLLDHAAAMLGQRLLSRWLNDDAESVQGALDPWLEEQWTSQGFTPDAIVSRLLKQCDFAEGQNLDAYFATITGANGRSARGVDVHFARQALSKLEHLVGIPNGSKGELDSQLSSAMSIIISVRDRVTQLVHGLVEQPEYRFAGAAAAIQWITKKIDQSLDYCKTTAEQAAIQAAAAYHDLQKFLDGARWWGATARASTALQTYPTTRLRYMLTRRLARVYGELRDHLTELTRDLAADRVRLNELVTTFMLETPAHVPAHATGQLDIREGANQLLESIMPDDMGHIDRHVQSVINQQVGGVRASCRPPRGDLNALMAALLEGCRSYLANRPEAASLFLPGGGDPNEAHHWLLQSFAEAEPLLESTTGADRSFTILAVPPGAAGNLIRNLAPETLPGIDCIVTECREATVVYRERTWVPLQGIPQTGSKARRAYDHLLMQQFPLHSRLDIRRWYGMTPE